MKKCLNNTFQMSARGEQKLSKMLNLIQEGVNIVKISLKF